MRTILVLLVSFVCSPALVLTLTAQDPAVPAIAAATASLDYVCPMDPDVRSDKPGKCKRCGMTLQLGIPDPIEYQVELVTSGNLHPGEAVQLKFVFRDLKDNSTVKNFEVVHEKLFHLFVISEDLKYFRHDHPVLGPDGTFTLDQSFPKPGMYRLLADVYPSGGTPQLLPQTVFVSSGPNDMPPLEQVKLNADEGIQHGENTNVEIIMDPPRPVAGSKTHLWFRFNTAEQMQMYLGAWAHMLIASDDLIDLIHEHPFLGDGGPKIQFDIIFPRARTYRVWLQFQRKGVVNTVAVNIPIITLEQAAASSRPR